MRPQRLTTVILVLALGFAATAATQQTADELYQAALYQEEVQGDLQNAITIYQRILSEHASNRAVAAKAQLHVGICYETLGLQEARQAYQRVVANYGDQADVVSQARARLVALRPAPAEGRGPVARRLLSGDDTHINNLITMMPSPDGRHVAYVDLQQGGMYVRDLASGAVEQLRPGMPTVWNWSPVWSPDGTRLAFQEISFETGVESIKILDVASGTVTVIPATEESYTGGQAGGLSPVAWSRDGRFLLYRSGINGGQVGIVPVGGGERTVLAEGVSSSGGAGFSPDGRYVTYAAGMGGSKQVFVQPSSGGARRQITDEPGGNASPLWSPDGRAIAYQRPDGIWVVPVTNGDVAGTPRLAFASTVSRTAVAWTEPGGLYLTTYNDQLLPYRLAVDPATGAPSGAAEELAHHPPSTRIVQVGPNNHFAWSPDRQRIAFAGWELDGQVAVYAADGNAIVSHTVAGPGERILDLWWSEDGREILYVSSTAEGRTVVALDPATGKVRDLFPRSTSLSVMAISDDGRIGLYRSREDPTNGLVVAETGKSGHRLVAAAVDSGGVPLGDGGFACLSPQGDKVFFVRQAQAGYTIGAPDAGTLWVVGTDGLGTRRLGIAPVITSGVSDPSGRFIAYTAYVDSTTYSLRVVEVETGVTRDIDIDLSPNSSELRVTDWSRDGKFIGFVARQSRWEYWVVQGLLEAAR